MRVPFNASGGPTLGVEWELQLVDRETRQLAQDAAEILEEIGPSDTEHPKAKHELFRSTIEIITGVCDDVPQARADILATRAEVAAAAEPRGLALVCSGAHPLTPPHEQRVSPRQRYHDLVERLQWPARSLAIYGVHVHVGVTARRKMIPIVNALTAYIPHLLALSASSPFWVGEDTGLASCRSKVFEGLPTAGLPVQFASWREFERYVEALVQAGSIETIREVWWDIRPHPNFGTVEIRIFDGVPTVDELMMLAAVSQCLVQRLDEQLDAGYELPRPPGWLVKENKWRATRYGLEADLVLDDRGRTAPLRGSVAALLEDLAPVADRLGCSSDLATGHRVLEIGPSYRRQREVAAAHGGNLLPVVDLLVREMAEGLR